MLLKKNTGLWLTAELTSGRGTKEPVEMGYFASALAQNLNVEWVFSIVNSFLGDRPNDLVETIDKMKFAP